MPEETPGGSVTDSNHEKIAVLDVTVYQDENRKIECVYFRPDHYGLRLTNAKGEVTKMGLSKIAAEQIAKGFRKILDAKPTRLKEQKFIMEPKTALVWIQAKE